MTLRGFPIPILQLDLLLYRTYFIKGIVHHHHYHSYNNLITVLFSFCYITGPLIHHDPVKLIDHECISDSLHDARGLGVCLSTLCIRMGTWRRCYTPEYKNAGCDWPFQLNCSEFENVANRIF